MLRVTRGSARTIGGKSATTRANPSYTSSFLTRLGHVRRREGRSGVWPLCFELSARHGFARSRSRSKARRKASAVRCIFSLRPAVAAVPFSQRPRFRYWKREGGGSQRCAGLWRGSRRRCCRRPLCRLSAAAAKYEDVAEQVPGRFYAVQLLRDRTHLDAAL